MRLSPPPRNLGNWSLRKPPCSDPKLRRDVRISSSSGSVRRASLTRRALFQMAPKWLAKTKYGAKPRPKATAPPPSPSPSPSHAPDARASAPIPALAPADRGAPHCAPEKAPATQPGAPQAPQSAPVPALAPADRGAPHSVPFRQIFGGSTAPKYLTEGVPSNTCGLYTPEIFDGRGSVKNLGGLQPQNI